MLSDSSSLYVGGSFWNAGGVGVAYIAKWSDPVGILEQNKADDFLTIYPNPVTDQITIEFDLTENKNTSIEIKNILGETIRQAVTAFSIGSNKIEIDLSEFPNGIYFAYLQKWNANHE
jgi:hypothetical protein